MYNLSSLNTCKRPAFSLTYEVKGSSLDTPIIVDTDVAAYLEDSEVQEHQRIVVKDFTT